MDGRYSQQFKKGALELVLLSLIARKETYGYEIITQLNDVGGRVFGGAKEGTIYPILYRLQDAGLLQCRLVPSPANGRSKKYYSLTGEGRRALEELAAFWRDYTACVDHFLTLAEDREEKK
ncbi:MAG TPA: PadR family transcriptional regulator [Candidatus Caccousia avistercoris]|mgnify:FL=1|nr:PadR family transcriptional regulator [Candidatus Caccousia avistercoris]